MLCVNCGTNNGNGANFCHTCGAALERKQSANQICPPWQQNFQPAMAYAQPQQNFQPAMANAQPQQGFQPTMVNARSQKSRGTAAVLALFLGTFGAHRFYAGKTGSAIAMLILALLGIFTSLIVIGWFLILADAIWALVDFFMVICGSFKDGQGRAI